MTDVGPVPPNSAQPVPASYLTLRGIRKSFGRECVLDGLNLDVSEGEYLVVLGPSGCGKSTLLQIIAGLVRPDSGDVKLASRSLDRVSPKDRDVSILFQDDRLYPHWNLRKNLELACDRSPVKKHQSGDPVLELAQRLNIGGLLQRRPDEISGGQLRRAALAKALLRQPAVCLLDEPFAAIDTMMREDLISLLADFPRERGGGCSQTSVVHVTHDGEEAMRLADRIVVLGGGRVLQSGTPDDIYRKPQSLDVAKAIGTPPANMIAGNQVRAMLADRYDQLVQALPGCHDSSTFIVRPEHIRLALQTDVSDRDGDICDGQWRLAATVLSSRFVAGRWLASISVDADRELVLTVSSPLEIGPAGRHVIAHVSLADIVCVPG
ncbi:ABC transporter ATP-binding protein [Aporhodopirellula aestuarii]|uniref:ABC transporter ATP-binding protein n=1 Tax=Aporhodopirellula aestuarii TaxID=2950107 RepID=A0ABT0U382_9BACT|nr:ABC transporter ATP-binding protein [Aporhodopirellula aestuarii]MCM2371356.1 ABC transporter ATP-binding protein [Aporhodopirellula aestuarii]